MFIRLSIDACLTKENEVYEMYVFFSVMKLTQCYIIGLMLLLLSSADKGGLMCG